MHLLPDKFIRHITCGSKRDLKKTSNRKEQEGCVLYQPLNQRKIICEFLWCCGVCDDGLVRLLNKILTCNIQSFFVFEVVDLW